MKNNIDKIKKLREELKEVINEYNSIDSDFDLSSNIQLLNEEAKELNQILSFLDTENSDLLKKIEFLKEDVNRRIQKLASENPFQTILKKFQKVYGKDCSDVLDLNDFFESQDKKNSVSNKNFNLKKVKDSDQHLNSLFENEIQKVKDISSNKQDFVLNNFDADSFSSLSKEEKLFYIFSKIDELKEKFQINLDFELSKNSDEIDYQSNNLLVKNIIDVVSKSYDDLKNEFTKKISWDEFVEKESDFNKGKILFDKKISNFKNLISNANLLENKYQKRLTNLSNSSLKNKYVELIDKQELGFNEYQVQLKRIFDSLYYTNQSLLKVKFDLSLNSYLKFLESIEVQIKNIENQNKVILSNNQEDFLLTGKEKDYSIEKTYYDQLCEISDKFLGKLKDQKEIISDYKNTLMSLFDSIVFDSDFDSIISKVTFETKHSLQFIKETFNSLKKELKTEISTLKQVLYVDKESKIYLASQQVVDLLNKGIDSSAKNLINDLEEYLEQIQDFFRDFLSKKIDLVEDRLSATENFEINDNKLPEKFVINSNNLSFEDKNDSNVVLISLINKKIENLENKFADFANTLENINNKLNKKDSDNTNKTYIEEISKNINSKFEELLQNLKTEMNSVSENNHNFVSGLIESNNREREYITNLLEKIDSEYQSTLDELELKRIAEGNKKLQDLENLIILQNQELQELLDDKNEVIDQIERVINQKTKNEQTSKNLEKVIEQISRNFESKIDNLESKFNEKLEEINVNSMMISSTDNDLYREITRNISELENQLSSNYESVKNSFKENFSEIIDKISTYGESSSHSELLNKKIEELNILLDNLKNDNKESLKNIAQDLQESSKKGVSEILENFDDKIGSIGKKLENKVDWYESNRQEEFNTLSNKLENLVADINKETEHNQRLVFDLIKNNNKEKEYVINYLQKIDEEHKYTLNELESKVISESSRKLQTLEDLIILQNNELEELLDDRNNAISEIEKIINSKTFSKKNETIQLEKTISEISKNFESRIDSLESRFNDKLQEIHVDSLTLASTDNDLYREITRNISGLENQLVSNYESVKTSFKESFDNLIDKIGYNNQTSYDEILNKRMDEMNALIASLREKNELSLQTLEENLKQSSKKDVSQILESFDDKIESIGQELGSKVDWYENNRQEEFTNLSEKISNQLKSLINDINDSTNANYQLVSNLIENNNKEKKYIVDFLQKIDSIHQSTLNELEAKVIAESSRKLQTLEDLIILQNNELEELLNDRNSVINEIEKVIHGKIKNQDTNPIHLEKTVSEISKNFESRIDSLESRFNDKLQEIHIDSLTLASTDNDLYRELSRNISGLESQLISNYESVKNSFKESFTDLINKIGYGNQSDYNEILNRKIDELNVLVDNLKEKNDVSFKTLEDNLKALSQKDVSKIIGSFDDKIGLISEKIESKVDWYENNRQEEFNVLSEKLNNKLENLVADINRETEQNQHLVSQLIENNNREKDYIINSLHKIDLLHQSTLNELETKVIAESSRKLQTLEDLIILQNNELEELLDDKNSVINEIEKIINNKTKNEENPVYLEKTILEISKNFESRIDNLESRFNDKLQEIHVDSLTLASTDNDLYREITRNINGLESQLVNNYESVKNSFKESFDNLINRIGYENQSEYSNALSRKVDELNVLVEDLRERNDSSLQALEENLRESSRKDVSKILESFDDKIDSISQELSSKVDWYENNRDERFTNLSDKISNQLKFLIEDINNSTEANQQLVVDLIEKNNREKNYILDFLQKADSLHKNTLNELETRVISESSRKLQTLEDLIILQNNELEELLDDRNSVINEIEKAIHNKVQNKETDPIHLEKTILEISKNFESRIDNLESRFNDKLQEIHVDSLTLSSTDSDLYREITRNINALENQLISNYESVKNSFNESFTEIINKIGYSNQTDYNEILSRKIDELNILVDSLKTKNEKSFLTLEENLKASSKKDISEMVETFSDKLGSISQEIGSKVDWYENNRQEELNTLSEKISDQLKYLINDIHNERIEDNQRFVDQIIKNNENEKQYIISLLNKMNEERINSIDENNLSRIMENNRRMQVLEDLIMLQNNELQELLDDKNSAINEIEKVILRNKEKLIKNGGSEEFKNGISNIIEKFDRKINDLENKLEEKFANIGSFSEGLNGVVSREVANSMSELENKLIENYESIKNSFKESFQDIESWVLSIASDKDNYDNSPKLNQILDAIKDLKDNSANFNPDELYENISSALLNELNKFSLNQYSLFENLEKNILSAIDKNVFDSIMKDFDYRLKELIEEVSFKNAENLKEIEDKLISMDDQFKSLHKMDKEAISQKLNESLETYQSLLEKSLEIVNSNYLNLKDLVQKVLARDREELTASELKKIVSLENKFNDLEKLILLQDEQTKELLNEKQNLLEKLVSLLKADNNDFDDVLRIIAIIDDKVKKFSNVLSSNVEINKNISEGNVFNETSQISDRVDALSQYLKTVSNNLDLLNLDYENIWMLDEIKNFGNLEFIHTKLNGLIDEIQSIGNNSYTDVQVIKKLDQIKLDLLSVENDLKLIRISIDSNNDSDIKEFNIKKSDFIASLIKENKILINNLLKQKESLVKNITDKASFDNNISESQKNNLEILLQGKAGIIFEIIFKEIQKIQAQNFEIFSFKLNELKNKLVNDFGWEASNQITYPFVVSKNLLEKIENIEKNLHKIFSEIDQKKNNFLNRLDLKVNDNDNLVKTIVNKFDQEKESLAETHQRKRKELRDLIINFKSKELDSYRKKLGTLNLEIKNLKNSNLSNDDSLIDFENSVDQGYEKLSLLEDLIENLTLEIDSFDEEKRAMLSEIENKINYLDDLNNPLKDGIIELESDNWNSDKFKKIVSKEAQEIINNKFLELKKDCDFNIEKIEATIEDLKNIHNQLFEIDKKLSDTSTLDKRINDLENLVFEPTKKSDEQNNNKFLNYHLKLIDDNVKFYVDELEKKKIEIANFYRKVRNLAINRRRK